MLSNDPQYPYEDMPEGRRPEPAPPRSGLDAARRRILLQSGMTPEEADHVLRDKAGVDRVARDAVTAANTRRLIGTTRASVDMIGWVDLFVAALNADAIKPEDF